MNEVGSIDWHVDYPRSHLAIVSRHPVFPEIQARFTRYQIVLSLHPTDMASSSLIVLIDPDSLDSGSAERDARLKSAAFLDVGQFPRILFRSEHITAVASEFVQVDGYLTIRGITRRLMLDVQVKSTLEGRRFAFDTSHTIARKDFGITWNTHIAGVPLIGDLVTVEAHVEVASAPQRGLQSDPHTFPEQP